MCSLSIDSALWRRLHCVCKLFLHPHISYVPFFIEAISGIIYNMMELHEYDAQAYTINLDDMSVLRWLKKNHHNGIYYLDNGDDWDEEITLCVGETEENELSEYCPDEYHPEYWMAWLFCWKE